MHQYDITFMIKLLSNVKIGNVDGWIVLSLWWWSNLNIFVPIGGNAQNNSFRYAINCISLSLISCIKEMIGCLFKLYEYKIAKIVLERNSLIILFFHFLLYFRIFAKPCLVIPNTSLRFVIWSDFVAITTKCNGRKF